MRKRPFGSDPPRPTKDDAEREAAEELSRLTRAARPPQGFRREPAAPTPPRRGTGPPLPSPGRSLGSFEPVRSPGPQSMRGGVTPDDEEEAITEMALHDLAERGGRGLEAFVIDRVDPDAVEATRDRALQDILERQARLQREARERNASRKPAGGSALERAAMRFSVSPLGADAPAAARPTKPRLAPSRPDLPVAAPAAPAPVPAKRVAVRKQAAVRKAAGTTKGASAGAAGQTKPVRKASASSPSSSRATTAGGAAGRAKAVRKSPPPAAGGTRSAKVSGSATGKRAAKRAR